MDAIILSYSYFRMRSLYNYSCYFLHFSTKVGDLNEDRSWKGSTISNTLFEGFISYSLYLEMLFGVFP
jgi:hypothetical protein